MNEMTNGQTTRDARLDPIADSPHAVRTSRGYRTRLLESTIGIAENLQTPGLRENRTPEDFSARYQVCLPYRGFFVWHVGHDDVVADANQVLFVSGGESFHLSEPLSCGYAELILTPDQEILAEIANARDGKLRQHPLFSRRSRRAHPRLQRARAHFLHRAQSSDWHGVAADELMLDLLRAALDVDAGGGLASGSTRRLIRRTKEFLEAYVSTPLRLRDIARAVGASPAYLTDVFRRIEGVPLHQYVVQLRLARALVDLPHANDLTALALNLGFSSHSHFAAAFRRAFGCTPSQYRVSARTHARMISGL